MWQEKLTKNVLSKLQYGAITLTTPYNTKIDFKSNDFKNSADLIIRNWKTINKTIKKFDIGFGESYMEGYWSTNNLTNLLIILLKNRQMLEENFKISWLNKKIFSLKNFFTRNTISKSKKNIIAHYDHGNKFYSLWLDPTMTYSSAIFKDNCSLEEAQLNKYRRIIEKIGKSNKSILEIGSGWGGFANFASDKDKIVVTCTNSPSQAFYAKEKLKNKKNVKVILDDYRNMQGIYDSIVSIGMFEHVGKNFWPIYFNKIKTLLKNNGRAVIQTIVSEKGWSKKHRPASFITEYIFPGGFLPSISEFKEEAEKAGLDVKDIYTFGDSYAKTLECWLENFNKNITKIQALQYSEKFIRCWRFYLSGSIAAFKTKETNVMQVVLEHKK